ncbi:MAG: OmpA family protein [Eubacteriales bacterium]|nr:OmpA family protein [Eubacteriales bacterium]
MQRRYQEEHHDRETFSPWETYSDLYCGLLLVFVLLFFFAIYQYLAASEKNAADTLAMQQSMQEEQEAVLAIYKADRDNQQSELDAKALQLEEQEALIGEQQATLDEQTIALGQQESQLQEQESRLNEQTALLESQQKQLEEQAEQIEAIVGIRTQLITALNQEMQKKQILVQADQTTGAIAFESEILFEKDSAVLSDEGKKFFENFMPVYLGTLFQEDFQDYIAEIIIEGHTDSSGSYLHNLELSQSRALSVAQYCLQKDSFLAEGQQKILRSLVTVNGCADKTPVLDDSGRVDEKKSRRVEIKFRLRDQEMIQQLGELLKNE